VIATTVDLAGTGITLETEDRRLQARYRDRYRAFVVPPDTGAFVIRHEVDDGLCAPPIEAWTDESEMGDVTHERDVLEIRARSFRATADFAARRAIVRGPSSLYPSEILFRRLLPVLLQDGLVFHAALLATDEAAWICAGPSGAGKSTLARLVGRRALCDELCAVRRAANGFVAHALPYWKGRRAAAPLKGVYLIGHGPAHASRRLSPTEAIRRLTPEVSWPQQSRDASESTLDTLLMLVESVPIRELRFLPVPSVWTEITRAAG
jgi:hypothetical protein